MKPEPQTKQAPAAPVEQEILQLEQAGVDAGVKHDYAFLQKLYADEYLLTNPDGSQATKPEVLASLDKVNFVSFKLEDMKVHVYGNTAVATGLNIIQATAGTEDISGQYRWTDVFVKRDGRWQAVVTQFSTVVPKK